MVFPSFVALSAQIKEYNNIELFLTYVHQGYTRSYLEFRKTAEVPSLIAKFAVERVKDSDLVHIRCCYNNYYLCRHKTSYPYIVAGAREPVEDKTAYFCTLFRHKFVENSKVMFTHIQSGHGLAYYQYNSEAYLHLNKNASVPFKVVDYDLLVRLPKRVTFKGNNGRYLRGRARKPCEPNFLKDFALFLPSNSGAGVINILLNETSEYNEFRAADGADRSTHYEISHYNGFIRIKSLHFGKFLSQSLDNWIWANSNNTSIDDVNTLFKVINLNNNVIALRNVGSNKVCRRLTTDLLVDCLNASECYVVPEAKLLVEEPVSFRKMSVQYRFEDAKIISERIIPRFNKIAFNTSKTKDDAIVGSFVYGKTKATKWSTTTTLATSSKTEINVSFPKYVGGKFELSDQRAQEDHFETGFTSSEQTTSTYQGNVAPMTKATIKGYVKEVTYEIPFSYFQTDTYTTGETVNTSADDGVCHGVESWDYYVKEEIPL